MLRSDVNFKHGTLSIRQLRVSPFGQREEERGMATADQVSLPALLQLFTGVLAYRLKHPVARATTVPVCPGRHQLLLNQPPQRLKYILGTYPPVGPTASAASSVKPLENTARLRNSTRSGSERRSWLHCRVALIVLWRSGISRAHPVDNARSSRESSVAGSKNLTFAAASSSARGSPASRQQMEAIAAAFSSSSLKIGEAARARSVHRRPAHPPVAANADAAPLYRDGLVDLGQSTCQGGRTAPPPRAGLRAGADSSTPKCAIVNTFVLIGRRGMLARLPVSSGPALVRYP